VKSFIEPVSEILAALSSELQVGGLNEKVHLHGQNILGY